MSPAPGERPESPWVLVAGLAVGLSLGALVMGLLGGVALSALLEQVEEPRAEPTFSVVVASKALAPGDVIALEDIARRDYPERFQSSFLVRADSATFVVGQTLGVPVQRGEPLRWTYFEALADPAPPVLEECRKGLAQHPGASATERTTEDIRARLMAGGKP